MAKLDPRKLMEQAMRQSVSEPRADGKANPLVGAVLWKPDGTVETARDPEGEQGVHRAGAGKGRGGARRRSRRQSPCRHWMERLRQWCEDINRVQSNVTYDFAYVDEESFEKFKPTSFRQLVDGFREYKEKISKRSTGRS